MPKVRWWMLAVTAAIAMAGRAQAQVRASEHAVVAQTIDGTTLTVEYSRPRARGRMKIWPGDTVAEGAKPKTLLEPGEVWTPGANWATTLEVDKDVTIEGHPLAKGKYSVWMELQPTAWTVIFDPRAKLFHTVHPKPDSTQVRVAVTPGAGTGPEALTWSFPEISMTGMTLEMAWAGRTVRLHVTVTPSHPFTIAQGLAGRYVGAYSLRWIPRDSTAAKADTTPPVLEKWTLSAKADSLLLTWDVPEDEEAPYHAILVNIGNDMFYPVFFEDDGIVDAAPDLTTEFSMANGQATGFVIRGRNDRISAVGTRVP